MKKIIIFGIGDNAELARFYFEHDPKYKESHEVVAFTVDKKYIPEKDKKFRGLPVVGFEDIENIYPPKEYYLFIAVGYTNMNEIRTEKYKVGKQKGFRFISYISSRANIFTQDIGENNFILEDNTIQPFVKIGNNNVLWSGNHIGHHGEIKDNCFITSHVVISGRCLIEDNCFIGVNSTIRDHIKISYKTLVAAGTYISKDTDSYGIYVGPKAVKLEKKSTDIKIS